MQTIPVVIPGIMGSKLSYAHLGHDQKLDLWSGDINANYERLIGGSGALEWNGNPADAEMIEHFTASVPVPLFGASIPIKRAPVWDRTLRWIQQHPVFDHELLVKFGYDWRAPLLESAAALGRRLSKTVGKDVSTARSADGPMFCIIAHSMGGIVSLLGIGGKYIHPTWIDRLVFIGSPIKGAPSAFSAAYDEISLPLFNEIFCLTRRNNMSLFYKHLLECIRSFPSIYSLFPPEDVPYLYYGNSSRSNPLRENSMQNDLKTIALRTHDLIQKALEVIDVFGVRAYTIYTEVNVRRDTDLEYRVIPHGPGYGYSIEERIASTAYGDGTVPRESARGAPHLRRHTVVNVDHAFLCNDLKVVECLTSLIPQGESHGSQLLSR